MSAEEPTIATAPSPMASTADLAAMLQQLQAAQAAAQVPVVTTAAAPNPLVNGLEAILSSASLANLAGGALNPLSMLALTSSLNQSSPVYQGIARVLLTMNMGQMLASQQTSELLAATINQQDPLMALLAARGGMPFQLPQQQQLQQGVFAVPQVPQIPHMSLKRNNKEQVVVGASDRKKSCPPLAMIGSGGGGQHQGHQPQQQQQQLPPTPPQPVAAAPVAPRSPSPPPKSMFDNLSPEMKAKNEMFRKEILRRLDIILLEELGTEDEEEDDKKSDIKQIPTSDEDDTDDSKTESMGAAGSAFRRILSRSSTIGNNSGSSPSASGTTSPSTGSLSSGPDSPPLERDPLSGDFMDMLSAVALKHKSVRFDELSLTTLDETVFLQKFPMMWTGRLALKSMETTINLHYLTGREQFLKDTLGNATIDEKPHRELVRITQRLRLDNGQIEHIHRILTNPDFACCIGLYSSSDIDGLAAGEYLQSSVIDYLNKKQIAGISCLDNSNDFSTSRVHVFAPCPLVSQYLQELCPTLYSYIQGTKLEFMFFVFTNDKLEPNMTLPSTPSELVVE